MGIRFRSLESVEMNFRFWQGKRVFLTGHTGFKGAWLSLWLQKLGTQVTGYALDSPSEPSLFQVADVATGMESIKGDILDMEMLRGSMQRAQPEVVIHLAAQSLVRRSYRQPVETYATNVMGTVNVLEVIRHTPSVRSAVMVTSDKCYENREWLRGYRENEALGGYDPYSSSKGCAELVTSAYRRSFFSDALGGQASIASARAGNVIGGGDWAEDRLVPDMMRAIAAGQPVRVRNPDAIRPWQHALEPLAGYLQLAEKLYQQGGDYAEAWNFGPREDDAKPVQWLVERIIQHWGDGARWELDGASQPHEAHYLKLDCTRATNLLGWQPCWSLGQALELVVDWHKQYQQGANMRDVSLQQVAAYMEAMTQ